MLKPREGERRRETLKAALDWAIGLVGGVKCCPMELAQSTAIFPSLGQVPAFPGSLWLQGSLRLTWLSSRRGPQAHPSPGLGLLHGPFRPDTPYPLLHRPSTVSLGDPRVLVSPHTPAVLGFAMCSGTQRSPPLPAEGWDYRCLKDTGAFLCVGYTKLS